MCDVLIAYAKSSLKRFDTVEDTTGRVLAGGVANRWNTRLKVGTRSVAGCLLLLFLWSCLLSVRGHHIECRTECLFRLADASVGVYCKDHTRIGRDQDRRVRKRGPLSCCASADVLC